MTDISTRAVIIGVSIFVTLTLVSLIVIMFFEMQEIYGLVLETDTDIYSQFNDVYSTYYGRVETGIGLLNTIKKQEENTDTYIVIKYPKCEQLRNEINNYNANVSNEDKKREAEELKKLMDENQSYYGEEFRYENKYKIDVINSNDGTIIIEYIKIGR